MDAEEIFAESVGGAEALALARHPTYGLRAEPDSRDPFRGWKPSRGWKPNGIGGDLGREACRANRRTRRLLVAI